MTLAAGTSEVVAAILAHREAIILSHVNPDADAFGSSCGLSRILSNLGLVTSVYNESGSVRRLEVIPGVTSVVRAIPETSGEGTVVIVCDCGAAERVGDTLISWLRACPNVINIDHHTANSKFGNVNLVVESASSTSEIIHGLATELERVSGKKGLIDRDAASALLAGIMGDTGSFRYSSTSADTFLTAHDLMVRGASPTEIAQELFANTSVAAIKLQSEAIGGMQLHFDGRFAEIVVTGEMIAKHGAELLDADSLAERARDVAGVKIGALFKQDGEIWRVSLRSRTPELDISTIARHFGGGGHKPAAAFRWRRDFATLQTELRAAVAALLGAHHA